jgi:hypothetical protein
LKTALIGKESRFQIVQLFRVVRHSPILPYLSASLTQRLLAQQIRFRRCEIEAIVLTGLSLKISIIEGFILGFKHTFSCLGTRRNKTIMRVCKSGYDKRQAHGIFDRLKQLMIFKLTNNVPLSWSSNRWIGAVKANFLPLEPAKTRIHIRFHSLSTDAPLSGRLLPRRHLKKYSSQNCIRPPAFDPLQTSDYLPKCDHNSALD